MAVSLLGFVTVFIIVLLILDLASILIRLSWTDDLLRLTEIILSWAAISGGIALGAGVAFRQNIKHRLGGNHQNSQTGTGTQSRAD
jgi:hypothetical protein